MHYKHRKSLLSTAILATSLSLSSTAFSALEEVVVTANKRAESINDVGLSISAVSGDKLQEQKLTSLEEISSAVPGLVYSTSTANTPIFTLRGVGFNEQSLGAYPATSLYLDEAPMPFPALASHAAFDLERMEVLKGPQGILFGQNSTGGAINFIAAKPTEEFEGGVELGYGSFNKVELNGYVSGPVSDTVGARLAVTSAKSDDWQRSASTNRENGEEDYTAARLIFTFDPSDTASYMVNINGWSDKSDPQASQFAAKNPQIIIDSVTGVAPGTLQPLLDEPFVPKDNRAADWSAAITPASDREYSQVILRGDWDLSESTTFTALTTYQDFEQSQTTDGDGSPLISFDLESSEAEIKTWITELRLAGQTESMNWVAGANYEASETFEDQVLRYVDNTNFTAANAFIHGTGIINDQEIENWAVFGNVDYNLSETLTVKAGARYTDSTIDVESCNYAADNFPGTPFVDFATGGVSIDVNGEQQNVANLFNLLGTLLGGGTPFTPVGGFPDCYTLNFDNVPGDLFVDTLAEDNVSWRLGIDLDLSDSSMLYANVSEGYKSGSFPSLAASTFSQFQPVTQESVLAFELGTKATLLDSTLQLNAALFHYKYEDKQLRTKIVEPIFGLLDVLENVPETEITGIEADLVWQVTEGLTLSAAVTYLDSEVTEYEGVSISSEIAPTGPGGSLELVGGPENFAGDPIPFTPELTYSLDADYRFELADGEMFMGLSVTGQSDSDAAFGGERLTYIATQIANGADAITPKINLMDGYSVLGARLGYEAADGKWRVMAWGKNLTDEYYITNVIASLDSTSRFTGRPRTYGITAGFNF
ncbi:TonB-dependent receptor [Haliea atlantica]